MDDADKPAFCRALGMFRSMYPNEFNMSELVPVAYWVACRGSPLGAVKGAMLQLLRKPEWLRQMPPAPVLAEQARLIERDRCQPSYCVSDDELPRDATSPEAAAWIAAANDLTELYVSTGLDRGPATLRAV